MSEDLVYGSHYLLGVSDHFQPHGSVEHPGNRFSRSSDTSSAYSGSDVMHTSLDDPDAPDVDLSGLAESLVDSDDEEGYAESTEVCAL